MTAAVLPENSSSWKQIVILYVEDQPQNYEELYSLIQEHCSEQSRHVKSWDAGRRIIESGDCKPHFVILDRNILYYDQEGTAARDDAGDMLYGFFLSCEIPVLLMTTADIETIETENPYRSDPPTLGFMRKYPNEASLREAVRRYLQYRGKTERDGTAG
jgi:hypothetical protein